MSSPEFDNSFRPLDEIEILRDQLRAYRDFDMFASEEVTELTGRIREIVIENSISPEIFELIMHASSTLDNYS